MAKLSFWELTEYDTKALEGIQSCDYLKGERELNFFSSESASLV